MASDDRQARIEACRRRLQELADLQAAGPTDVENDHVEADEALLDCIDDPEVRRLFDSLRLWYA